MAKKAAKPAKPMKDLKTKSSTDKKVKGGARRHENPVTVGSLTAPTRGRPFAASSLVQAFSVILDEMSPRRPDTMRAMVLDAAGQPLRQAESRDADARA